MSPSSHRQGGVRVASLPTGVDESSRAHIVWSCSTLGGGLRRVHRVHGADGAITDARRAVAAVQPLAQVCRQPHPLAVPSADRRHPSLVRTNNLCFLTRQLNGS
eukprot:945076-Prorocentrum_minimum.AAC.1